MKRHYITLEHPNFSLLLQDVAEKLEYMQSLNKIPYYIFYGHYIYDSTHYMVIHYRSIGCE